MEDGSMKHRFVKHCPDPETLAAWVDAGLHGDESARVERHAAGCARCQAHLAAMARMRSADQAVVEPQPTPHLWRWLVPAAAGVTAVALWILVLPPQPATEPPTEPPTEPTQSSPQAMQSPEPASPPPAATLDNRAPAADIAAAPEASARALEQRSDTAFVRERAEAENKVAAQKATPLGAAAPAAKESAAMVRLGALPIEIVSPDPSRRWRVGRSLIERSTDSGVSWEAQPLEISEYLTAGVAPSTSVVWVVGQRGAVLLTTDGQTWRRVPFPVAIDLVSVQATDGTHATVTTFDGRTYSTTDASTWSPQ